MGSFVRMERVKVKKFPGVYYREHPERKHNGRPDRCFDISFKVGGRKIWEKVGWMSEGYSAAAASQVRGDRVRAVRHGEELPSQKRRVPTFGECWTKYLTWAESNKKTASSDEFRYRAFRKDLEHKRMNEISPLMLERIKSRRLKAGKANQTVKHDLALIRRVFNKAREWGLYDGAAPTEKVKAPQTNTASRVRFLTLEEAHDLLEEVAKHSTQWYEICLVSLHTGMRAGEVFAMRQGDLDFTNAIIHVHGKGGVPRTAYMTPDVKALLAAKPAGGADDFVFTGRYGGRIEKVSGTYKQAVARLGLNDGVTDRRQRVCFHTLRHTFASWLAIRGVPIFTIRELMGHKRIEMTLRYAHLSPSAKQDVVQDLQTFFNSQATDKAEEAVR